jgi:hypothetical protein
MTRKNTTTTHPVDETLKQNMETCVRQLAIEAVASERKGISYPVLLTPQVFAALKYSFTNGVKQVQRDFIKNTDYKEMPITMVNAAQIHMKVQPFLRFVRKSHGKYRSFMEPLGDELLEKYENNQLGQNDDKDVSSEDEDSTFSEKSAIDTESELDGEMETEMEVEMEMPIAVVPTSSRREKTNGPQITEETIAAMMDKLAEEAHKVQAGDPECQFPIGVSAKTMAALGWTNEYRIIIREIKGNSLLTENRDFEVSFSGNTRCMVNHTVVSNPYKSSRTFLTSCFVTLLGVAV